MTRGSLERVLSELLELPCDRGNGLPIKIVNTILRTMTNALMKGDSVHIRGLGILSVRTKPPTRSPCYMFYGRKTRGLPLIIKDIPAKRYVHFQPTKPILRNLNANRDTTSST